MYSGFPVDLLVLLRASPICSRSHRTTARSSGRSRRPHGWSRAGGRSFRGSSSSSRRCPAMAGALGSAGVALLAPLALRLARRYDIDRRMIGLMVVHGAAAGNFSPLNVLSAIVRQAVGRERPRDRRRRTLFLGNLALQRRARRHHLPGVRVPVSGAVPDDDDRHRPRRAIVDHVEHRRSLRAPGRRPGLHAARSPCRGRRGARLRPQHRDSSRSPPVPRST